MCEPGQLVVEGSHDGYRPHKHTRRFEQTSGRLRIVDRLAGPARAAAVGFLLHPEVTVSLDSEGASLARGDVRAQFRASIDIACEDAVWGPDMGQERATKRLRLTAPPGTNEITSEFIWSTPRGET